MHQESSHTFPPLAEKSVGFLTPPALVCLLSGVLWHLSAVSCSLDFCSGSLSPISVSHSLHARQQTQSNSLISVFRCLSFVSFFFLR